MASKQLIQEELQNSAVVSRSSPSSQIGDTDNAGTLYRAVQLGMASGGRSNVEAFDNEHYTGESDEHEDSDYGHVEDDESDSEGVVGDELDGEDDTMLQSSVATRRFRTKPNHGSSHDEEDDDSADEHDDDDDDVVEDDEGVGAVKIRPGETDDDSEASAGASDSSDDEWEEQALNADDFDEDEEEEGEEEEDENDDGDDRADEPQEIYEAFDVEGARPRQGYQRCLYCRRRFGEPRKYGDNFVECNRCGTAEAHVECSTKYEDHADASNKGSWSCPDCTGMSHNIEAASPSADEQMELDEGVTRKAADTGFANITPSKVAGNTIVVASTPKSSPALRGLTAGAESASGDHTDGGRSLRKRPTSPIGSAGSGMSLRKRRKNTSDDLNIDRLSSTHNSTVPKSVRVLRIKPPEPLQVTVVKQTEDSLILKIKVAPADLRRITVKKRKYTKRGTGPPKISKKEKKRLMELAAENGLSIDSSVLPLMPSTTVYTQPFYSFFDKETDEQKGKPYGGILTEAETDTSKTFPTPDDRRRFDDAKQRAEEEWRARLLATQAEAEAQPVRKKKTSGPASQIECIEFGGWEIDTWYAAPYPEEYSRNRVLYICEFCLKYMNSDYVAWRHKLKCPAKHPPGDEIYRHESISFFEVDGRKNPVYCQNLCLLAKLFLGSKTLYYDVEPFLFYVLCEYDEFGYHFVGYFSKEKRASSQNNVSCILTLPIHQRKGYGNLLIDFSYLLTRVEEKTGSPEKPLSDMGLVSYRNYWRLVMCRYLLDAMTENKDAKLGLSIKQISDDTGMTADDVISALEGLRCLVRDPQSGLYAFRVDLAYCREYLAKWESKKYVTLKPAALTWTPYVMGRGNATNFELGPALTAIAPREEDDDQKAAEQFVASLANGNSMTIDDDCPTDDRGIDLTTAESAVDAAGDRPIFTSTFATVLESTEPSDQDGFAPGLIEQPGVISTIDDLTGGSTADPAAHLDGDDDARSDAVVVAKSISGIKSENKDDDGSGEAKRPSLPAVNGFATQPFHNTATSALSAVAGAQKTGGDEWASAYDSIPATRFVVFPPVSARRLNSYTRAPIGRPPGSRTGRGTRGRRRHSTGYVRQGPAAVSTPRPETPSSSKKKSGGTGRGPGRWPKGTKKSDYGNAESGPGLPPAWLQARTSTVGFLPPDSGTLQERNGDISVKGHDENDGPRAEDDEEHSGGHDDEDNDRDAEGEDEPRLATPTPSVGANDEDDAEGEDDDAIMADIDRVQAPATPSSRPAEKRGALNGVVLASGTRGRSSPRLGKIKATSGDDDTVMMDAGKT
ncbi:Histone acetyltransferase [Sporothrix epigloea]|uniref:Histone acetyltransferase n=1 Tax=Sporothrix epigloea TaxID=1892477 RepID=A0ABP0D7D4_9PEZI